jgi:transposase-like protein
MRSPGRPPVGRREHRERFWLAIASGSSSEDAGVAAGVSPAVGTRWFREGGGMPTLSRAPLSGRSLSFAEREELAILRAQDVGVRETARRLGRSPSTISRELRRNAATRGGRLEYRATTAQWHADQRAERPKVARLAANERLRDYVRQRLAGEITRPDGTPCQGRRCGGSVVGTGAARTAGGRTRGVRSRLPTGCGSTSPMMGPCGSLTRPSTRRCRSKAAAPCAVS